MSIHVSRTFVLPALLAVGLALVAGIIVAQPPFQLPENATEAELQEVVVPLSDAVRRRISEALARDAKQDEPGGSTGDPILDDVLDVIRRQGSVLDGSSLDAKSPSPITVVEQESPGAVAAPALGPGLPVPAPSFDPQQSFSGPDARFHVAESLLRASRELSTLPGRDQQRNRLIAAMREQATVLMIDEFSQSPNGSE